MDTISKIPAEKHLTQFEPHVDDVTVKARLRPIDEAKVQALMTSMRDLGLLHPIHVYAPDSHTCELVAGAHRLAAAIRLKWERIPACKVAMPERERQIWEIEENLVRSELSPAERQRHMLLAKQLWDEGQRAEKVAHGAPPSPPAKPNSGGFVPVVPKPATGRGMKGFASVKAADLGLSKSQINRDLAKAKALTVNATRPTATATAAATTAKPRVVTKAKVPATGKAKTGASSSALAGPPAGVRQAYDSLVELAGFAGSVAPNAVADAFRRDTTLRARAADLGIWLDKIIAALSSPSDRSLQH